VADIADRAQILSEFFLATSLADGDRMLPAAQATGECLWCGERLPDGRRWCDVECRDEWDRNIARGELK